MKFCVDCKHYKDKNSFLWKLIGSDIGICAGRVTHWNDEYSGYAAFDVMNGDMLDSAVDAAIDAAREVKP